MKTSEEVIAWCRAGGVTDQTGLARHCLGDLRYSAHEAAHALALDLPYGGWDSDSIHEGIMSLKPLRRGVLEVHARAVEQIVCEAHSISYDPEVWAVNACLEAMKHGCCRFESPTQFVGFVKSVRREREVTSVAKKIMAARKTRVKVKAR